MSNVPQAELLTIDQEKALSAEAKTGPFQHTTPVVGNDVQSGETPRLSSKRHAGSTPPTAPAPVVLLPDRTAQIVRPLPETMSRDEMLQHYSAHANLCAHEALQYQKRIRDLEKALSAAPADWGTPHDVGGAPWGAPAPAVCDGGTCGLGGYCTNCPRLSAAPAVPDLKHKPTVQRLMDLARKFRSAPGDLYDGAYKELQSACYEALSAAPVVREPLTDAQIDKIFDDAHENMPKGELFRTFVTRAIERAHGIGGGGK